MDTCSIIVLHMPPGCKAPSVVRLTANTSLLADIPGKGKVKGGKKVKRSLSVRSVAKPPEHKLLARLYHDQRPRNINEVHDEPNRFCAPYTGAGRGQVHGSLGMNGFRRSLRISPAQLQYGTWLWLVLLQVLRHCSHTENTLWYVCGCTCAGIGDFPPRAGTGGQLQCHPSLFSRLLSKVHATGNANAPTYLGSM